MFGKFIAVAAATLLVSVPANASVTCAIVDTSKTPSPVVNTVEYPTDISGQVPPGFSSPLVVQCAGLGSAGIGWNFVNGAFVNPNPPPAPPAAPPTSVAVVSQSNPALSGTYAFDTVTQSKILAVSLYIQVNGKFPAGQTSLPWPDASGTMHTFTTAQFQSLASALADYATALDLGNSPTSPITIP